MGGGEHGGHGAEDFRTKVWSMSGGPYCRPKHWRRNTAIAMFGVFLICIPIAMKSAELETAYIPMILLAKRSSFLQQRPHQPVRPIPSQLWCKNFGNKDY
ncbi:hypothetical protein CXB51_016962 [Gossypium anomalum]|uniref:Transmembrane protein n=11 Tax=Gossypium TaxID=3633 RepID=A0A7J9B8U7_GOSGO|nr:hypothetical protein CXB51_016962 [Gossypium anomalum]MBA0605201.1 hypothetical protein [Gossypium davidsonii]MBA0640111.1 hypothetical protein [Gossypium klotzschianum]MBA0732726.1 hypothetical protein [Gossypium gossypioides]MBA0757972.1 hypothetical protein [Gossypium trilobum]MBA0846826.1 hypothetical protein [Gossypium schwendimanii]